MKVVQEKSFQPVTLILETEEELKVMVAALNVSNKNLKQQWDNMGYGGSVESDLNSTLWRQVVFILENNQ